MNHDDLYNSTIYHQIIHALWASASTHRRSVDFVSQLQRNRTSRVTIETRVLHCRLIDANLHGPNMTKCTRTVAPNPRCRQTTARCHDDVDDDVHAISYDDMLKLLESCCENCTNGWMPNGPWLLAPRVHVTKAKGGGAGRGPVCFPLPLVPRNFPGTPYYVVGIC